MAFRSWNPQHLANFNSDASSEFMNDYESYVEQKIKANAEKPSSRTFAASSFRCDRWSWFRIRGSKSEISIPDATLNFTADIGTACHRIIQDNLKSMLGEDWIAVRDHINSIDFPYQYILEEDEFGFESLVQIEEPPIKFACDGIVRRNGVKYLLEIKTSEYASWNDLLEPKPYHVDQVKCYATLLQLPNVLFLYQDRQYGGLKCFEITVKSYEMDQIKNRFAKVLDLAKKNLAPDPLPKGDPWCTPSRCPYYKVCGEYGR